MYQKLYFISPISIKRLSCLIFVFSLFVFTSCQKQINYQPQIDALKSSITSLQNQCDSLNSALTQTTNKLNTLTTNVSKLSGSIDSIKTQLTVINTQITQLNTELSQNTANISSIQARITQLSTQYQALLVQLNLILSELSSPSLSISNGLVAYYPFSGNAIDSSGNGNNGTVNGATLTKDRFGKLNNAYSFDGLSNFIELPILTALQNGTKATLSVWVNTNYNYPTDPVSNSSYIFSQWSTTIAAANVNIGIEIGVRGYNHSYSASFVSGTIVTSNTNLIPANTWANLTMVYDGTQANLSQRLAIYVNGAFSSYIGNSNIQTSIGSLNDRTVIGAFIGDNLAVGSPNHIGYYFSGQLDDFRIYNRVLTSQEIQYIASH